MKLEFKHISRNGILEVDFNQLVFEVPQNQLTKRKLNATDPSVWTKRYDVAYDLFDFVLSQIVTWIQNTSSFTEKMNLQENEDACVLQGSDERV